MALCGTCHAIFCGNSHCFVQRLQTRWLAKNKVPFSDLDITFAVYHRYDRKDHPGYESKKIIKFMSLATRALVPFFVIFFIVNIIIGACWDVFQKWGTDNFVLLGANALFLLMNIFVFLIQKKALSNKNPNVFIRSIMSGMMIKMFGCVIAVLIYTTTAGKAFNKSAVFISLVLYLVYLGAEVAIMTKLNKNHHG